MHFNKKEIESIYDLSRNDKIFPLHAVEKFLISAFSQILF